MNVIEKEIVKATGLKPRIKEDRQIFLARLLEGGQELSESAWDGLTPEAQKWYNTAIKAYNASRDANDIPDFDDGVLPTAEVEPEAEPEETEPEDSEYEPEEADAEYEPEEEADAEPEPAPKPARMPRQEVRPAAAPTPAKPLAARPVADKPAVAASIGRQQLQPRPVQEVAPVPTRRERAAAQAAAALEPKRPRAGVLTIVKRMILKNPQVTVAELIKAMTDAGFKASPLSISTIRSEFRHSIKVLQEAGFVEHIEL